MSILTLIDEVKVVTQDIKDGAYYKAWKDSIPLQVDAQTLIDSITGLSGGKMMAIAQKDAQSFKAACDDLQAALSAADHVANIEKMGASGDPVGKLGDGTILKAIWALLLQLLPILLPLIIPASKATP